MKGEIETLFFHYLFHLYHKEEKEFERLYEYNMIYNKKKFDTSIATKYKK